MRESGLTPDQADAVIHSDAFGPLTAELRRAEAHHFDVDDPASARGCEPAGSTMPRTSQPSFAPESRRR